MVDVESEQRRVLLVSDIHSHWENFSTCIRWAKSQPKFDYIFVMGDQAVAAHKPDKPINKEEDQHAVEANIKIMESLEEIVDEPNRIFYIPGNHDAECLYDVDPPQHGKTAKNIHRQAVEIEEGLILAGMGGSHPMQYKAPGSDDWISKW